MRRTLLAFASLLSLAAPGIAHADSLDIRFGIGSGGYGYRDGRADWICSGRRADQLERRLGHEEQEGEIDSYTADRIHDQIDRIEDKQRHECREGDWGAVRWIASRYDQIDRWIDREAHGRGRDW